MSPFLIFGIVLYLIGWVFTSRYIIRRIQRSFPSLPLKGGDWFTAWVFPGGSLWPLSFPIFYFVWDRPRVDKNGQPLPPKRTRSTPTRRFFGAYNWHDDLHA